MLRRHQWVVLDGDVDPEWIESMNSVMDDNRVLTLANNERITVQPWTKLLFEVADLTHASPATVSRGGVLYFDSGEVSSTRLTNPRMDAQRICIHATEFFLVGDNKEEVQMGSAVFIDMHVA
jgi:hypothetical protein